MLSNKQNTDEKLIYLKYPHLVLGKGTNLIIFQINDSVWFGLNSNWKTNIMFWTFVKRKLNNVVKTTKRWKTNSNFTEYPHIFFEKDSLVDNIDHSDPSCAAGTINGQILILPLVQVWPQTCNRGQIRIPDPSRAAGTINGQILILPLVQVWPRT